MQPFYDCRNCSSIAIGTTGRKQHNRGKALYEVECGTCGFFAWTSHPNVAAMWEARHANPTPRSVVRTGVPTPTWRKLNEGVTPGQIAYGGAAGGGKTIRKLVEMMRETNDVLGDMKFDEVHYTQLHERVRLEPIAIRALKRLAPHIFPEFTDLQAAQEELMRAWERVQRMETTWAALGAEPEAPKKATRKARRK